MDRPSPEAPLSKSERKRQHQALKRLGRELSSLPKGQLDRIPLDENLRHAVLEAARLERSALQRQLRYLASLLAKSDAEAILRALEEIKGRHAQAVSQQHRLEQWRDDLINEGDQALARVIQSLPNAPRGELRDLVRRAAEKGPRAAALGSAESCSAVYAVSMTKRQNREDTLDLPRPTVPPAEQANLNRTPGRTIRLTVGGDEPSAERVAGDRLALDGADPRSRSPRLARHCRA